MPLSWNEIKDRALKFSKEWEHDSNEDAEAKSFWDDFFNVFGISRRRVASFEQQVKKIGDKQGYIDLLWKGLILVEHKSRGKDLNRAYQQAKDYFPGLTEKELPRYILVSDFERFRLYDLETDTQHEFKLNDFVNQVHHFGFIAGYQKRTYKEQDPVNIEAAELMGRLHDKLKNIGYNGHPLEVYLVRLLFCLFADDTGIFERGIFNEYIELKTKEDGSDLAAILSQLFEVLNTPKEQRLRNIDESLAAFPYVNGKLFEERLPVASFDSHMRKLLLDCCLLDWGKISPAIFGSLFQSVMDEKARRNLGAHYTSEKNILKLIKPLFLDELWAEFYSVKDTQSRLKKFHSKISNLRFLDPACGCGNFLIIAYREIRLLEIEIIKTQLFQHLKLRAEVAASSGVDIGQLIKCDVDRFYGIEYEEFPAQIAQVAMWLMDHQMNQQVSNDFGEYYVRLPLRKSATIVHGNALRIDWQSLIDPMPWEGDPRFDYILGNPPFVGQQLQNKEQKEDMSNIFNRINSGGVLDYVAAWYVKAAEYIVNTSSKVAFVSTNSISQGEQVGILWKILFTKYNIKILFAHQTFNWTNEAKGKAAVHVIIIGFASFDGENKRIYKYEHIKSDPHELYVKNINPYLFEGKDILLESRSEPIANVPKIKRGNSPYDGGHFLFSESEKDEFLLNEPESKKYFKNFIGAKEYINAEKKFCLWLLKANPADLNNLKFVKDRINKVKIFRENSPGKETQSYATTPSLFRDKNNPKSFIVIPRVSSENRKYIPMGFFNSEYIAGDTCMTVFDGKLYHFGVLVSIMHMAWVKYVCGRLKSDYRYSKDIVYNNFPWPENPTARQKEAIEKAAQKVLDVRANYPGSSLADLYDPLTMPPDLVKAHNELDKAVDLAYRPQPFISEAKRMEFLFELYEKYTAGLFVKEKKKRK